MLSLAGPRKQSSGTHLEPAGDQPFAVDEGIAARIVRRTHRLGRGGRRCRRILASPVTQAESSKDSRQDSTTPREMWLPKSAKSLSRRTGPQPPIIPDSIALAHASDSELNVSQAIQIILITRRNHDLRALSSLPICSFCGCSAFYPPHELPQHLHRRGFLVPANGCLDCSRSFLIGRPLRCLKCDGALSLAGFALARFG